MRPYRSHLNLLRESEKLSSSPVRVKVMLPILALLLCLGCAVWWSVLFMQSMMLNGERRSLTAELDGKKSAHSAILSEMARARDMQAELDQLLAYGKGRRTYGDLLARLAAAVPAKVQLTSIVLPEPPAQNLRVPNAPKAPPLLGPVETTEPTSLRLTGRTVKAAPVTSMLETMEGAGFGKWLVVDRTGPVDKQSPRVHSFRQESGAVKAGGDRLLAFDVEFRGVERRFEK